MQKIVKQWDEININSPYSLYTIQRLTPPELSHFAGGLAKKPFFMEGNLSNDDLSSAMHPLLAWDISTNFAKFQEAISKKGELKVQSHQKDSCKLFHVDEIFARMIITYCGPGTEYTKDDNINWNQIGSEWSNFEEYNCRVLKDRDDVSVMQPLYIHVLFGNKSGKPQIHRAPDVQETGKIRFTAIGTIW